jgi:multidrug efflux pump subunit AcrB
MISIPLAILTSVGLLAATGETINVMTLGDLALAWLINDTTVTIENISYHLSRARTSKRDHTARGRSSFPRRFVHLHRVRAGSRLAGRRL